MRMILQDLTRKGMEPDYTGTELTLPASDTAIRAAFDRAGIRKNTDEYLIQWPEQKAGYMPRVLEKTIGKLVWEQQPPIDALNLLAARLQAMGKEGRDVMDYLAVHRQPQCIHDILNWTYNTGCCSIEREITSNEELLLTRSGIYPPTEEYQELTETTNIFDQLYLSYGGYHITEEEEGWVTASGYCTYKEGYQWRDVFDGGESIFNGEWNQDRQPFDITTLEPDLRQYLTQGGEWDMDLLGQEYAAVGMHDIPPHVLQAEALALATRQMKVEAASIQNGHQREEPWADGENGRNPLERWDCGLSPDIQL